MFTVYTHSCIGCKCIHAHILLRIKIKFNIFKFIIKIKFITTLFVVHTGSMHSDEIPLSDATQCLPDKSTSLEQPKPVGVLMKQEEFFQELAIKQQQMNTSKLVT